MEVSFFCKISASAVKSSNLGFYRIRIFSEVFGVKRFDDVQNFIHLVTFYLKGKAAAAVVGAGVFKNDIIALFKAGNGLTGLIQTPRFNIGGIVGYFKLLGGVAGCHAAVGRIRPDRNIARRQINASVVTAVVGG